MNRPIAKLSLFLVSVVGLITAAVSAYLIPHIALIWQISLGLAIALFAALAVLSRTTIAEIFSRRTTKYGLNALVVSIIGVAITVVINLIANEYDWKEDFTKNKVHTLSDQSVKVIQGLAQEVTLKAFVNPQQITDFDNLFSKYTYHSKRLKKEFIDIDKDPMSLQRLNIKHSGTIIVESGTRTARVENLMGADDPKVEEKLTNALIAVSKGDKKKVYFVTGHGERLVSDTNKDGYSMAKENLENSRFKVEEILTLDKKDIPADAEVVVVAGPQSDLMDHEIKMFDAYLKRGGKMLFMVEPKSSATVTKFLSLYGVDWKPNHAVFEGNQLQQLAGGNPLAPIVVSYDAGHEITKSTRQATIFPISTPVEKAAKVPDKVRVATLFSTSTASFDVEIKGNQVRVDQKPTKKGPLTLGLAVSANLVEAPPPAAAPTPAEGSKEKPEEKAKTAETRLVVVGDSDFASNGVQNFGMNSDLFQNMMSWLAQEEDLISIRPKSLEETSFELTEARMRIIFFASVLVAPLVMFLSGITVWVTRRRK